MSDVALELDRVSFSYGSLQVLFEVSLAVRQGEVLALLGTNGAGKSTILRVATGLEVPRSGTVRFHGDDVTALTPEERTRLGLVLVQGGKAVFPDLTVDENLAVGATLLRHDRSRMIDAIGEAYDRFPALGRLRRSAAGTLSGGEQQMLGLAKALLLRPRLLAIDELSLGLAPIVVEHLLTILQDRHADDLTIVLVEQSLTVATSIATRALFLEKGRIRFDGDPAELAERDDLARAVLFGSSS